MAVKSIAVGVYLIGGDELSRADDAAVGLLDCDGALVMVDAGAGRSTRTLLRNIEETGLDPARLTAVILTHAHIDHIGSAAWFRERYDCRIIAHTLDADAIVQGDPIRTAANWYDRPAPQTPVDVPLTGEGETLRFGNREIHWLHTPGHTPGSIVVWLERDNQRILFGQDIHGPFLDAFGSDRAQWRTSMEKVLALQTDILCEGHFGVFRPAGRVERYIRGYLDRYAAEG